MYSYWEGNNETWKIDGKMFINPFSRMIFWHNNLFVYLQIHVFNTSKAELNRFCHFLVLLGAHRILHVSRIRVKYPLKHEYFTVPYMAANFWFSVSLLAVLQNNKLIRFLLRVMFGLHLRFSFSNLYQYLHKKSYIYVKPIMTANFVNIIVL